jgi:hypothetical protein
MKTLEGGYRGTSLSLKVVTMMSQLVTLDITLGAAFSFRSLSLFE